MDRWQDKEKYNFVFNFLNLWLNYTLAINKSKMKWAKVCFSWLWVSLKQCHLTFDSDTKGIQCVFQKRIFYPAKEFTVFNRSQHVAFVPYENVNKLENSKSKIIAFQERRVYSSNHLSRLCSVIDIDEFRALLRIKRRRLTIICHGRKVDKNLF